MNDETAKNPMKQKFDGLRTRRMRGVRRSSPKTRAEQRIQLQHSAWAAAIVGRFSQGKRLSMCPESLVFLDVARRRVLMLRTLQPKFQVTNNYLSQLTTLLTTTTYLKEVVHHSGTALSLPKQQPLSPVLQRPERSFLPPSSTLLIQREIRERTQPAFLPVDARPRPMLRLAAGTTSFEHGLPLQKKRLHKMKHGDETTLTLESKPSLLAMRVVRQLQRVETRGIGEQSAAELVTSPVPAAERVFAIAQANPRKQRLEAVEESLPERRNARPAPEINVAQLTEQVLNQLDRRLVAARERMGRI
jgi:hypothetical protein